MRVGAMTQTLIWGLLVHAQEAISLNNIMNLSIGRYATTR